MESIWQKTAQLPRFAALQGNKKTDVLIIGGGIAGILTAYYLKQAGIDSILVEKGQLCQGTTSYTTGKITTQHGLVYHKLCKRWGIEGAQKYFTANQSALESYRRLCGQISCDFETKDNYVYTFDNEALLERELTVLGKMGVKVEFCRDLPLPVATAGAIKFPEQAQFHPLKFLAEIVKDLTIYENTFVKEMRGNTAVTDHGSIHGKTVIVTTHFPFINKHGSYFLKLYQHRSYVIAYENAQDVRGMYVDDSHAGLSFRNYGKYLLLGGGGHRTGKKGGNWEGLRQFAGQHYPRAQQICRWAAQDCMSLDDVPYMGRYSNRTGRLFVATGFNKWGMTGAMVAAQLLCEMVQGKENAYGDIFLPSRSICRPQLLVNGFESVTNLLSFTGKRCPHLGCALKWNPAEHSWDCACHGSRFDENGRVLDNPANGK